MDGIRGENHQRKIPICVTDRIGMRCVYMHLWNWQQGGGIDDGSPQEDLRMNRMR